MCADRGQAASGLARVERVVDAARDRLTAVEDAAQSAKALYAALAPPQQRMADPRLANLIAAASR